jgi:ABC-2 type transport system permease protein
LISAIQIPPNFLILAIVYFILGYLLFAVIAAGIGAISSTSREGQQLVGMLTIPAFIPIWFMSPLIFFPDSPAWIVLTIFPLTAPVQTIVRMGVSDIPVWQIATNITILLACIIGGLFLMTRIFRAYLLMYGKRPGIREIFQSIRNG